jgi:hypothetical protein
MCFFFFLFFLPVYTGAHNHYYDVEVFVYCFLAGFIGHLIYVLQK